jgi:hypothetical protein
MSHSRSLRWLIVLMLSLSWGAAAHAGPITVDPLNPHYFTYNGQTIALVGVSGEYLCHVTCITSPGATTCDQLTRNSDGSTVLASDYFCRYESYSDYINDLAAHGLNTMRLYISLNHSPGWQDNKGKPYDYEEPFPANGSQWDLSSWSAAFFNRVRAVLALAQSKGIIVEVTLFDPWDPGFAHSPWNPPNNLQQTGWSDPQYYASFQSGETCPAIQSYSITDSLPRHKQIAVLQRAAFRLNDFNNFYWEIANEPELANPPNGVSSAAATAWHDCMVRQLYSFEATQPNGHHLIGVEYHAKSSIDSLINGTFPLSSPNVALVNSHYVKVANGTPDPYGAVLMIRDYNGGANGQLGRIFGFNEGRITPSLSKNPPPPIPPDLTAVSARAEAWEFMFSGGGAFDHLGYDWKYSSVAHDVRNYLGNLNAVLRGLGPDLVNMTRDGWCGPKSSCWIRNLQGYGSPEASCGSPAWQGSTYWAAMHSPSNYLLYQHHSQYSTEQYIRYRPPAAGCSYRESDSPTHLLQFRPVQSGSYKAKWIDPATGIVSSCTPLGSLTAGVDYALPPSQFYSYDVALWVQAGSTCP